jgi:putative ABC transport system permease protein
LSLAQSLVGLEGRVTEYAVAVHDRAAVDEVAQRLRQALGPDYEVQTWKDVQPFLRDAVQNQAFVLGLVGFILFIIVLTGIVNTMLMSVFERVREIGTMLAFGVRRRQVMLLFLMESMFIALAGGVAGGVIGRVLVWAIAQKGIRFAASNAQDNILRPEVNSGFVALVIVAALFGASLSALYPAWKASRQNPVDALRSL